MTGGLHQIIASDAMPFIGAALIVALACVIALYRSLAPDPWLCPHCKAINFSDHDICDDCMMDRRDPS